jgi:hypothetical protein
MDDVAQYRFLPWSRRGLAAEVGGADTGGALPVRATVHAGVTVTGAGTTGIDLSLYGPGDILGIDTRLIVRTDPRPNSTDAEPNYLPAIEFDPPDFPWAFTPARPGAGDRLRPWLVLVCVDRAVVSPPQVSLQGGVRGPLPVLQVPSSAVATELPDLRESWGWAHTQVATEEGAGPVDGAQLDRDPALNVSRLVCPRRLQPGKRYVACLVPAFDVGAFRGLTGQQPTATTIGPAWDVQTPADLTLPVFYHWEFDTGPAGDFEELARKLRPFKCPPTVGYAPMHVGAAGPELPSIPAGQAGAQLDMDGALRSPSGSPGSLGDVDPDLREALRRALDAAADNADASADAETPVMGPPLYGEWHVKRHRVPANRPTWFRDLNVDPRTRVGAGLGTEVVRANQEEFVHAAWEQVGQVLAANALLNSARLSMEAAGRLHERHVKTLPGHRLLQLAAPMHDRVVLAESTVRATVAGTSLPDAAADPALRRLTGGRHPILRRAARKAGVALTEGGAAAPMKLYASLAAGRADVDPNVFTPDGLEAVSGLQAVDVPSAGDAAVDLTATGLPIEVPANVLREGRQRYRAAGRAIGAVEEGAAVTPTRLRDDLRLTGLVTLEHLRALAQTPRRTGGNVEESGDLPDALSRLREAAVSNPGATAFLVDATSATLRVHALDVDARGRVLARTAVTSDSIPVAELGEGLRGARTETLSRALGNLDPGSLASPRRGREVSVIDTAGADRPILVDRGAGIAVGPTNTVPAPVRDVAVLDRFQRAWAGVQARVASAADLPARTVVPFGVAAAARAVVRGTDPVTVVPKRLATMLWVRGRSLLAEVIDGLEVVATMDRILAAPDLPAPVYEYLARYDRDRFLPGVDVIPPNAITLLETNPQFVEAFMVGMNHEMNRELLWREYPTDRRGTPFRHFWGWLDGGADIIPIHTWPPANILGRNARGGEGGQLVLLVRGDLLRRYPNTVVYAWRAEAGRLKDPPQRADLVAPVFAGRFDPDFTFFGFPLTDADLEGDAWFFVLQEQPTEPRFGFDESVGAAPGPIGKWSDATWEHTGTAPGAHLILAGNPLSGQAHGGVTFGANAGHLAAIALQKPVRVAVRSGQLYVEE